MSGHSSTALTVEGDAEKDPMHLKLLLDNSHSIEYARKRKCEQERTRKEKKRNKEKRRGREGKGKKGKKDE